MDLICYLQDGWAPFIRPAPATRAWMDDTPASFAYRCLPLNIANAQGWEILSPCGFEAVWSGGSGTSDVTIRVDEGTKTAFVPVSIFGHGIFTFHVEGIFRTPLGWNLWVMGSPNSPKHGVCPLSGIIETDWSPFTFTMNWRLTKPGELVRFEYLEPFAFFFPMPRNMVEDFTPRTASIDDEPELKQRFQEWSQGRRDFQKRIAAEPPKAPADRWQKHYYRGVATNGDVLTDDHRTKVRVKPFDLSATPKVKAPPQA